MSDRPSLIRPESDLYTVLVIIATAVVLAGTIFLFVRSQQLFGTWNPFTRG